MRVDVCRYNVQSDTVRQECFGKYTGAPVQRRQQDYRCTGPPPLPLTETPTKSAINEIIQEQTPRNVTVIMLATSQFVPGPALPASRLAAPTYTRMISTGRRIQRPSRSRGFQGSDVICRAGTPRCHEPCPGCFEGCPFNFPPCRFERK